MIRATTGGVLKSYRYNLMNSFISQNKTMNTILSQRNFNSYAEDPAAAAKAFRMRKSRMTVNSQHSICADTLKKYETGYSCLQSIDEVLDTKDGQYGMYMKTLKGTTLSMLNDPTGDAREQLSKVLDQMSEMLVQNMNQKYGDSFIFAGADGHNVPFEVVGNQLTYRGVPVDAAMPNVVTTGTGANEKPMEISTANPPVVAPGGGVYLKQPITSALIKKDEYDAANPQPNVLIQNATANPQILQAFNEKGEAVDPGTYTGDIYYLDMDKVNTEQLTMTKEEYEKQKLDAEKLDYLANEKYFVDIGLGFQENANGKLIESSGFNASLNGITFMGYGLDEDGDPKNLYSLVQKMRQVADSVPEAGKWDTPTWEEFDRLVGKFETACSDFKTEFTNMAANTTKLENNEKLLEDNFYNLQEQYADIEDIDPVEAINSFLWAQYSYNAALKVGNSVLSETLMDYLT